jgi:hypothetical protein
MFDRKQIVASKNEPNKKDIWLNDDYLKIYNAGAWKTINNLPSSNKEESIDITDCFEEYYHGEEYDTDDLETIHTYTTYKLNYDLLYKKLGVTCSQEDPEYIQQIINAVIKLGELDIKYTLGTKNKDCILHSTAEKGLRPFQSRSDSPNFNPKTNQVTLSSTSISITPSTIVFADEDTSERKVELVPIKYRYLQIDPDSLLDYLPYIGISVRDFYVYGNKFNDETVYAPKFKFELVNGSAEGTYADLDALTIQYTPIFGSRTSELDAIQVSNSGDYAGILSK